MSVGIRAHRTWYCQRERSVHPLCMSGKSIIIRVGRLVSVQSSPRGARQSHVPTFQLGRVSRSLGHRQRRQVESGRWSRAARGVQDRKKPHISHKSAPPRKSTHPHFRTIFERSSSRNIATRYGFPTYVNFVGQKTGVRALEQGECGALGALHHEAFDFLFGGRFFFFEKWESAPKRRLCTALGHEPGRFGPQESPPLWNATY